MASGVFGFNNLSKKLSDLSPTVKKIVFKQMVKGGALIEGDAKREIQTGTKSGKTYRKGSTGGKVVGNRVKFVDGKVVRGSSIKKGITGFNFHRASAPGEAPATDTGNLVTRINARFFEDDLRVEIGIHDLSENGAPYARRLELGGKDTRGVFIAARPYLQPAYDSNIDKIVQNIAIAINQAFKVQKSAG